MPCHLQYPSVARVEWQYAGCSPRCRVALVVLDLVRSITGGPIREYFRPAAVSKLVNPQPLTASPGTAVPGWGCSSTPPRAAGAHATQHGRFEPHGARGGAQIRMSSGARTCSRSVNSLYSQHKATVLWRRVARPACSMQGRAGCCIVYMYKYMCL